MAALQNILLDSYMKKGTGMSDFRETVQNMANNTNTLPVKGTEITFLSLCRESKFQTPGKAVFHIITPDSLDEFMYSAVPLPIGSIPMDTLGKELYEELEEGTGLMVVISGDKYIISKNALQMFSRRANAGSSAFSNRNNLARDIHFADAVFSRGEWRSKYCNMLYRRAGSIGKIFSVFSPAFVFTRQDMILRAMDDSNWPFQGYHVKNFCITNYITDVMMESSETESMVKGIEIRTSDTGNSSFVFRGTVRTGNDYAIVSEFSLTHDRNLTHDSFIQTAKDAAASKAAELFMKHMDELKKIPALDYSSLDFSLAADRETNCRILTGILDKAADELYASILHKTNKSYREIRRHLSSQLDSGEEYTLYDLSCILLSAARHMEEQGLYDVTCTSLRKAASRIPYVMSLLQTVKPAEENSATIVA